ncbi:portal protein [Brucella sp. C7-11G]
MAEKLQKPDDTISDKDLTKEALARLEDARAQKSLVEPDLREGYFFTRPRLAREVSSRSQPSVTIRDDAAELATGIGAEVSEDFATEAISAFFPQNTQWVESSVDAAILAGAEQAEIDDLKKGIVQYDKVIFSAINSSNFNAELAVALDPDLSLGTVGLWIDSPGGGRPVKVDHVPARELEINVGPDGEIDDRFRVRHVRAAKLRSVAPDVQLPTEVENKIKKNSKALIEVVWGFWRDWSKPHDDVYQHVMLVDRKLVHKTSLDGEGSVPLIAARFSPDKLHAWGNGPTVKSLQEFRVLDVITAGTQDAVDLALQPPIGYPDDGVLDFEGGIEAGKAYPMRPGGGKDITKLSFEGNPDLGFYTASDLERRIRRKFFADYPEQKGDTPPTATQWVDEMVRAQRRIGTPGLKFWRECPYQIYRRFEYLLEKDGLLEPLTINGAKVPLTPNNPATQAQDNQKLVVASNLLGLIKQYFPMTSQAAIDELRTIDKMKVLVKDEIIQLRDPALVEQFISQIMGQAAEQEIASEPPAA